MHAVEFAPRDRQIARMLGAARHDHGVEFLQQLFRRHCVRAAAAHGLAYPELHALGAHLLHAPVDQLLFQFEVGNAIAQQTADAVVLFVQHHIVAGARQLLRAGEAGRTRTDYRHPLAGLARRRQRQHPAHLPALVDDGVLDRLDPHGIVVDVERASRFARRRTDAAGEFWKIIGRMQRLQRCAPVLLVDQVVPVRNDVVDRAAAHAERRAAVHAARPLHRRLLIGEVQHKLVVMLLARRGGFARLLQPLEFHEAGDLAHLP